MREHITGAQLQRMADDLEKVVRQLGLATEAELAPWRPGGDRNLSEDAGGALKWYTRVQRIHGRQEKGEKAGVEQTQAEADADRIITAALANEPELVHLYAPPPSLKEPGGTFAVYPKSFHAMVTLAGIDVALAKLTEALDYLWTHDTAESVDAIGLALEQVSYRHSQAMWILNDPDPALPYDDRAGLFPVVPSLYRQIDALDIPRIMAAHHTVNGLRLKYLEQLLQAQPAGEGRRRGWASFFVDAAESLKQDVQHLIRHESLVKIMARLKVGADSANRREQQRERKRKRTSKVRR